jgi:hypothetical protein
MPTMYEYSDGFWNGNAYVPGINKRDVVNLGAKMVTLEGGRRYEHRGRFKATFEEAKAALVAELEAESANWRKYLAANEAKLSAARALTDGVKASDGKCLG